MTDLTIGDRVWFQPGPESDAPDEGVPEERIGIVSRILEYGCDGNGYMCSSIPWEPRRGFVTRIETVDGGEGEPIKPAAP